MEVNYILVLLPMATHKVSYGDFSVIIMYHLLSQELLGQAIVAERPILGDCAGAEVKFTERF